MDRGPRLFDVVEVAVPDEDRCARVVNRHGTVSWAVDDESFADVAWSVADGRVLAWVRDDLLVELALVPVDWRPLRWIPSGMALDDMWLGVWRLRSTVPVSVPRLTCFLSEGATGLEGGGSTGEHLDAQTWEDESRRLSIGTEDAEMLYARAASGGRLPKAWAEIFLPFAEASRKADWSRYPTDMVEFGMAIDLPTLPPDELCQVHHAVAWQVVGIGNEVSTWCAVDVDPSEILFAWRQRWPK